MKALLLLIFMLSPFCALTVGAQNKSATFEEVVSKLQTYTETNAQEKIHIHFDKPIYSVGDTVWFKLYLINASERQLSGISKVVYIDVKQKDGKTNSLVLPVNAGMANAQLLLSDTLYSQGTYQLRAYTQWMRNAGEANFFNYDLKIDDDALNASSITSKNMEQSKTVSSLEFFPEGGFLVNGLRSKIAFKALATDGLSLPVKGYVADEQGQRMSNFESTNTGMGLFALTPQSEKNYIAILENGQQFKLPTALKQGFVLAVNRGTDQNIIVNISKTASMETTKEIRVLVQSHGQVLEAIKLPMNDNSINFGLQKNKLLAGINQITLFAENNQVLAERLIFVEKENNSLLSIDKSNYTTKQQVKLNFDNGLAMVGAYSVAIAKTNEPPQQETEQLSIQSNLLLNSDLAPIESPNTYFSNTTVTSTDALDLLMLCQSWNNSNWERILGNQPEKPKYLAENGITISGKVLTAKGDKALANAKVRLLVAKELLFLDTVTNDAGIFSFENLQLSDKTDIILKASGTKDSKQVKIVLDQTEEVGAFKAKKPTTSLATLIAPPPGSVNEQQNIGKIKQGTTLKTVEIVAKKPVAIKGSAYPAVAPPADYTFEPDKLQEMNSLADHLRGLNGIVVIGDQIRGRGPATDGNGNKGTVYKEGPMTILLNGMPVDDLSGINPKALTGVQIVRGGTIAANMATSLMLPNGSTSYGIVFLTMKGIPSKYIKTNRAPGLMQLTIAGYTNALEFYAPNYETTQTDTKDFRSTLLWKPNLITGEDGKTALSFYTSDEKGKYRITLEGIAANGELCRKVSYFSVD